MRLFPPFLAVKVFAHQKNCWHKYTPGVWLLRGDDRGAQRLRRKATLWNPAHNTLWASERDSSWWHDRQAQPLLRRGGESQIMGHQQSFGVILPEQGVRVSTPFSFYRFLQQSIAKPISPATERPKKAKMQYGLFAIQSIASMSASVLVCIGVY